ncbi:hypothetical protein NFI96_029580 [Prochilodus magdalenae]|nr:hypothetical protein NFI96_029580 [Prochilodus magdalenae]
MARTASLLFVLLNVWTTCLALECRVVPGSLKQIDVGNGQVFGVNSNNQSYTLYNGDWIQVPGSLMHVSVGPAGVWGVDPNNYIYKLVGGDWVIVGGRLKQVDAGGMISPAGVNMFDDIFCLTGGLGAAWVNIPGKLKYYSCGPYSCWGVNSADNIFIMKASVDDDDVNDDDVNGDDVSDNVNGDNVDDEDDDDDDDDGDVDDGDVNDDDADDDDVDDDNVDDDDVNDSDVNDDNVDDDNFDDDNDVDDDDVNDDDVNDDDVNDDDVNDDKFMMTIDDDDVNDDDDDDHVKGDNVDDDDDDDVNDDDADDDDVDDNNVDDNDVNDSDVNDDDVNDDDVDDDDVDDDDGVTQTACTGSRNWELISGALSMIEVATDGSVYGVNSIGDIYQRYIYCVHFGDGPFLLQHDRTPVHRASSIKTRRSESGVEELDWPAQSPDLHPIEHLWDGLEQRLRARPSRPTSVSDLTHVLLEEWEGVSPGNPAGTGWFHFQHPQKVKHASYDLGHLWLIGIDDSIMDCTV